MKPLSFNEYKWEPISNLKEFEEILYDLYIDSLANMGKNRDTLERLK